MYRHAGNVKSADLSELRAAADRLAEVLADVKKGAVP
jgi:hypothetical protein